MWSLSDVQLQSDGGALSRRFTVNNDADLVYLTRLCRRRIASLLTACFDAAAAAAAAQAS